jgi:hypothetical protein
MIFVPFYSSNAQISTIPSPKIQTEQGVLPVLVQCKEGLDLIIKFNTNSPACVTVSTAESLFIRGWGTSVENISIDMYENTATLPFGLFTYNLYQNKLRHPPPLSLSIYGDSLDNPSLSILTSKVTDPSLTLLPSYTPTDQERKFTMVSSHGDGERISLFFMPSSVDVSTISTLDDVFNHNGYVILLKNNEYSSELVDAFVAEYSPSGNVEKIYINNFPAISIIGDPTKGQKSEIVFYDENEIKIDIFSIAYTPAELVQIAESLFN